MTVREPVGKARVEPLVLEVVADVRQGRRREAELDDPNAFVLALAAAFGLARPRLYDDDPWPRRRRPFASSYVLQPLPPQTGGNESVARRSLQC